MPVTDATHARGGIGLLLDWIDALRRADADRIRDLLDPSVSWHGVTEELTCDGREQVMQVMEGQLPMCMRAEALELVVAPKHLILGTRNRSLPDPPDLALSGQSYNVYELDDGRISEIRDFAARKDAFRAADLDDQDEWR